MLCCKLEVVVICFRYQVCSYEILLRVFSLSLCIVKKNIDVTLFYFCINMFTVIYNRNVVSLICVVLLICNRFINRRNVK